MRPRLKGFHHSPCGHLFKGLLQAHEDTLPYSVISFGFFGLLPPPSQASLERASPRPSLA